jgi:PilZ domain
MIALQYERKRARVVVSSIDSRDRNNIILGVVLIADGECPWEALLERPKIEKQNDNRRRFKRHAVELPVELRDESSEISVRVLSTDVCGSGCYLQTMATARVGTVFLASFWYAGMRFTCECTVRTCDPGLGMGIEFTGLDDDARNQLQHWLNAQHRDASQTAKA